MIRSILGTTAPAQVAIIVNDVETAKNSFAKFWGLEVPPTVDAGVYEVTRTVYKGAPNELADCNMAFFDLGNIQFEIIEPNAAPSTWRDWLETHGEGLHHLAYKVPDIFQGMQAMKDAGYECTMWGYYGDASGAYAYFDCMADLKMYVELLCDFK